jgi:hypothetical protein
MRNNQRFNMLLLGVMLSGTVFSPAYSRQWKPTPVQMAADYAGIEHNKGNGDFVNIRWWAATATQPGTPLALLLEKFIVVSVVHFHIQQPTSTITFDDIATLSARDSNNVPLALISISALPPAAIGAVTSLKAGLRQSVGKLGDSTKFFVFDAGKVRACEKGGISVPYDGETYTWKTPFPGCSNTSVR